MSANDVAKLVLGDSEYNFPIFTGTEGEKAIVVSKMRAETGVVTLDPGYLNTGSCTSAITFLNGEKGILQYRGYPIEQLAEKASFEEVSYLLVNGELPNAEQLQSYCEEIGRMGAVPAELLEIIKKIPSSTHPMGAISASINLLCSYYPEYLKPHLSESERHQVMTQVFAQVKTLAAAQYRFSKGLPLIASQKDLSFARDFVNMMFGDQLTEEKMVVLEKALNILFVLHADHEQNCSTSTVRIVGSSQANVFASIAAGCSALWGPSHGGANQAVIEMLEMIQADGGGYKKFIQRAKDKNDDFRLMGFGHRVYKNFDPRARIIKGVCDDVLASLGVTDPILDIAKGLEAEALKDQYFVDRKLYPNVDFYSGIIFKAMGIPSEMFTVMFTLGRTPGWLAQWNELVSQPMKIGRPRQIYIGENRRDYVQLNQR